MNKDLKDIIKKIFKAQIILDNLKLMVKKGSKNIKELRAKKRKMDWKLNRGLER